MNNRLATFLCTLFTAYTLVSGFTASAAGTSVPFDMFTCAETESETSFTAECLMRAQEATEYVLPDGAYTDENRFFLRTVAASDFATRIIDAGSVRAFTGAAPPREYVVPVFITRDGYEQICGEINIGYDPVAACYKCTFSEEQSPLYWQFTTRADAEKFAVANGLGNLTDILFFDARGSGGICAVYLNTDAGEFFYASRDGAPDLFPLTDFLEMRRLADERERHSLAKDLAEMLSGENGLASSLLPRIISVLGIFAAVTVAAIIVSFIVSRKRNGNG